MRLWENLVWNVWVYGFRLDGTLRNDELELSPMDRAWRWPLPPGISVKGSAMMLFGKKKFFYFFSFLFALKNDARLIIRGIRADEFVPAYGYAGAGKFEG